MDRYEENLHAAIDAAHEDAMSERCTACGADTDGTAAVWRQDDKGRDVKFPLCHDGPSPTCYERWTWMLPTTTHPRR